jgi:hypothetical protein
VQVLRVVLLVGAAAALSCGRPRVVTEPVPVPAPEEVEWTLLLAGDAGGPYEDDPVLAALTRTAAVAPGRSTIVFLGDNIYPRGLPDSLDPLRPEMDRRLLRQVETATTTGAYAYFIPGNHDWDKHGPDGWNAIVRQGDAVRRMGAGQAELLPPGGCPGPEVRDVGARLRLVLVDTHWFLHPNERPGPAECTPGAEQAVADSLAGALRDAGDREVIVLAHHPLRSGGKHGGHFSLATHILPLREIKPWLWVPLPIIGSIYPIARANGVTDQDVSGARNRRMREALEAAMRPHRPLVYASGHEHNLQVLAGASARWLLVSGSGYFDHAGRAHWLDSTRYAAQASGFMRLDVLTDGRIRLGVLEVDGAGAIRETFSHWLD